MANPKHLHLFVALLNKYLYYYYTECQWVSEEDINKLTELISEHIANIKGEGKTEAIMETLTFLENTKKSVEHKQKKVAKFNLLNFP